VVFTRSATPFRAAVVGKNLPSPLTISSEITILRPHSAVLPEYLAAVLSTPAYAELLKDLAYRRHPSALKRLRLKDVRSLPIPLPSRSVQAEIKEAYEHAATLSEKAREELGQIVHVVHAEIDARVDTAVVPDHQFTAMKSQLGSRWDVSFMRGVQLRKQLENDKTMRPLLELARPVPSSLRGISDEEEVLVVQADDVNEITFLVESIDRCRLGDLSSRMRQPLAVGDVILCTTGAGDQIAYLDAQLSDSDIPILGSATFTALRFQETPRFYTVALSHPLVRTQLDLLSGGSVQRFVNKRDLDELLVPCLGVVWREDFDARIARAMDRRREALAARTRLLNAAEAFVRKGWTI